MLMMSVKMVFYADQTIVQLHLVSNLKLIAVINQFLEMNIFVHLKVLVEKMKGIAILMISVRLVLLVEQTTALLHLVLTLKLIVVIPMIIHAMIPVEILTRKVITIVMMQTTIVDVNGMGETVVEVMLIYNFVQPVNA